MWASRLGYVSAAHAIATTYNFDLADGEFGEAAVPVVVGKKKTEVAAAKVAGDADPAVPEIYRVMEYRVKAKPSSDAGTEPEYKVSSDAGTEAGTNNVVPPSESEKSARYVSNTPL